jgi:hypothetical protein
MAAMARTGMERSGRAAEIRALRNHDIGEALRLGLFQKQSLISRAERRAYDLSLQNLVKETNGPHGGIAFAGRIAATLSCDHRVVDGVPGTELLAAFKVVNIENPLRMLV